MAAPQYKPKHKWQKIGARGSQAGFSGEYAAMYLKEGSCVASLMGQPGRRAWSFDVTGQGGYRRTGAGYTYEVALMRAEQAFDACRGGQMNGCMVGACGELGSLFSEFTGRASKHIHAGIHKAKRTIKRTAKRGWRTTR